jgi:hypothetical protein
MRVWAMFSASDSAVHRWQPTANMIETAPLDGFVTMLGSADWSDRIAALTEAGRMPTRAGRAILQRHCIELTIERLRRMPLTRLPSAAERCIVADTAEALSTLLGLSRPGREQFLARLRASLVGQGCLVDTFHLLRIAAMRRSQGFQVQFAGFELGAPFDLLIRRGGVAAEIACDVLSAEEGRGIHRRAWLRLVDGLDRELQAWLRSNPGRYLMKMTLHGRLHDEDDVLQAKVQTRIRNTLRHRTFSEGDVAATVRLEPLALPTANADEPSLMPRLRHEFGPEAHLTVISAGGSVIALAARAERENDVATAVNRHLKAAASSRLSGQHPGVIALFIEDLDQLEWRLLRETLQLEGEIRQFMTHKVASCVAAVSCTSRLELFGMVSAGAEPQGEVRFRNPSHPSAKLEALAPAVSSSS